MPRYQVIKPGFFGGMMYEPDGPRSVLNKEHEFPEKDKVEQVPSWLKRIDELTPAQQKAANKKAAAEKKKQDDKLKQDQIDIDEVTTELDSGSKVEVLG